MTSKNFGRATLAALPFVLALIVGLVVHLTVQDRLPDRLAVHFNAGGSADRYTGITAYLLYGLGTLLVLGALWAVFAVNGKLYGRGRSWLIGGGFALAAFLGYLLITVLLVNVDAPEGGRRTASRSGTSRWRSGPGRSPGRSAPCSPGLPPRPRARMTVTGAGRAGNASRSRTAKWRAGPAGSARGGRRSPYWPCWRPPSRSAGT